MAGYCDKWICADCSVELLQEEIYMVHDAVWLSVMPGDTGHLCLLCLEERLGRPLDATADFTGAPINNRMAAKLEWVHWQGRAGIAELSRARRARLDRRAEQRRARLQRKRALDSHSAS